MDIINTEAVAREARKGINELHKKTIGLFRPYKMDRPNLVINNDNGHLSCANFGILKKGKLIILRSVVLVNRS